MSVDRAALFKQLLEDAKTMEGRGGADNPDPALLQEIRDAILGGSGK